MKFFLLALILWVAGCVAVVDQTPSGEKIKSFIIPKEDVKEILTQAEEKYPQQTNEYIILEKRKK